jgi:hypothetical protein
VKFVCFGSRTSVKREKKKQVQIVRWLSKLLGVVSLGIKEVPECLARTTLSSSKPSQRDFGALHKCRK